MKKRVGIGLLGIKHDACQEILSFLNEFGNVFLSRAVEDRVRVNGDMNPPAACRVSTVVSMSSVMQEQMWPA